MNCPVCGTSDKISAKDEPRFYRDGRLTAVCWHGHGNGRKVVFDAETGSLFQHEELQPYELLYRESETAAQARGLGGAFLARYAGIFAVTQGVVERSRPNVVTEQDVLDAAKDGAVLTVAPQYLGARLVGLEVRRVEVKAGQKVSRTFKMEGARGVYIADPTLQPDAVLIFEGTWDAATAAWDAFDHDEADRYAFCSIPADFSAKLLKETLSAHFPGIPALIISDQDGAGKGLRARMANAGVAHPAILKGVGRAKDYRDADPAIRWDALMAAVEAVNQAPAPNAETGSTKVARRLFEGCIRAKAQGMRDLESWRFGQRCAGICKSTQGGKRYYSIRAVLYGRTPSSEGLHDFDQILQHPKFREIQQDHPELAAIVLGGPTESPMSSEWRPPVFVEDGRHWTEIPKDQRKAYATSRGWEPWTGREVGEHRPGDLSECLEAIRSAFAFTIIPGAPHSEVGSRVLAMTMALALCGMRAEEKWLAGEPTGFLPWGWFYGDPGTGKGTAGRIVAAAVSGDVRTYGSQRFGGERESTWLTESVIHLPIAFKDELDTFLERPALEDLKTFIAGEALQKRKAYGTDMTIAPRPVVFSTNEIKVNADDTPTKERIILCQLDKNPLASDQARNNAFEVFHDWLEDGGGKLTLYRASIQLYKQFRRVPIGKSTYTRSAMFDAAVDLVSAALGYKGVEIMRPSKENKEEAILHGSPWYRAIQDFIAHELDEADGSHAKAHEVWSISLDESGKRKMRRYITQFKDAAKAAGGHLVIGGFQVSIQPFQSSLASQSLIFRKGSLHVSA